MLLDKVKLALRQSGSAFNDEATDLINAAIADLRLVGIVVNTTGTGSLTDVSDPLLVRAIVLYAKAEFGYMNDAERFRKSYDYLKCSLSMSEDYTETMIVPANASFDKNTSAQAYADVPTTVRNDTAADVQSGGATIGTSNFTIASGTVTIKKEYLATLPNGVATFDIAMLSGRSAALAVNIVETPD